MSVDEKAMEQETYKASPPPNECLFADFSSNAHNLAFDKDKDGGLGARFASLRIGDGETVEGKRIHE